MKKFILNTIIAFAFLSACTRSHTLPEFVRAEALMTKHPDSALIILDSMKVPSQKNARLYATYCLLLTQARDKNYNFGYKPHSSDSLIKIAVAYFDKRNDLERKATAWYYAGRVYTDMRDNKQAVECYLKAHEYANQTQNHNLRALVSTHLGTLYFNTRGYEKALKMRKEALECNTLANDTSGCIYSLRDIGRSMVTLKQNDSALIYFNKALALSKEVGDTFIRPSILNEMGAYYYTLQNYSQAIHYAKEAISTRRVTTGFEDHYLVLGRIYREMNQPDSARAYLTEALKSPNLSTQAGAYYHLYKNEEQAGKLKEAIEYNKNYLTLRDSISKITSDAAVTEIQAKYDNEVLINANNRLKLEKTSQQKTYAYLVIVLLVLFMLTYLFYRHKMQKKEEEIINSQLLIQNHKTKIMENERTILRNIEALSEKELQLSESKQWLEENEQLMQQNEALRMGIKAQEESYRTKIENSRSQYVKERAELIDKNDNLYHSLQQMVEKLIQQHSLLNKLRLCAQKQNIFPKNDFPKVEETINELYNGFADRLAETYPNLTKDDILICCLLKLRLKSAEIAAVTDSSNDAIYKRNQRIRHRIELDKTQSLEEFLMLF